MSIPAAVSIYTRAVARAEEARAGAYLAALATEPDAYASDAFGPTPAAIAAGGRAIAAGWAAALPHAVIASRALARWAEMAAADIFAHRPEVRPAWALAGYPWDPA